MFRLLYNFGKVEGGARGESFQKAKMETVAEALKPESADVFRRVPRSRLRSSVHQGPRGAASLQRPTSILFLQSGDENMETGEWLNLPAAGEFRLLPGGAGREDPPHFRPAREMLRANSHLHKPFPFVIIRVP